MDRNVLLVVGEFTLILFGFIVAGLVGSVITAAIILLVSTIFLFRLTHNLASALEKLNKMKDS